MKALRILGTRGIPARHGGFETFAESLALYLVSRGWAVTVYCQPEGDGEVREENWRGVRLVHMPVKQGGALGTVIFDWRSTVHASREDGLVLTLGYNTAAFCLWYRMKGIVNLINMDGIEWKRKKWSSLAKVWLYLNERLGCWLGNHLIADHPEIQSHLASRVSLDKITMIPYGGDAVAGGDQSALADRGITPGEYGIVIARPEPENSILEIVTAFSRKRRGRKLLVLGRYNPEEDEYHERVIAAASEEVHFLGAIYDKATVNALRQHARFYIHGHTVGGTNPSLVEALGASLPVLAHGNKFNRWVAGEGASYFSSIEECDAHLDRLCVDDAAIQASRRNSARQFEERFRWETVHQGYEQLLEHWLWRSESAALPRLGLPRRFSVSRKTVV